MVSDADMWPAKIALPYRFVRTLKCFAYGSFLALICVIVCRRKARWRSSGTSWFSTTICSDRVRTHFKHPKTRTPPVGFLFPSDRSVVCVFHSSRGGSFPSHHAAVQRTSRSLYKVIIAAITGIRREAHARDTSLVRYGLAFLLEHGFMVRIAARLALRRHSTDARAPFAAHAQGPHVLPVRSSLAFCQFVVTRS
jgi:hypothetical protein